MESHQSLSQTPATKVFQTRVDHGFAYMWPSKSVEHHDPHQNLLACLSSNDCVPRPHLSFGGNHPTPAKNAWGAWRLHSACSLALVPKKKRVDHQLVVEVISK